MLFIIFITVKIILFPRDQKNLGRWTRVFQAFPIFMYSKIMILTLDNTKNKIFLRGILYN
jgi:hypothetical protein